MNGYGLTVLTLPSENVAIGNIMPVNSSSVKTAAYPPPSMARVVVVICEGLGAVVVVGRAIGAQ